MVKFNVIMVSFVILVVAGTCIPSLAVEENEPKSYGINVLLKSVQSVRSISFLKFLEMELHQFLVARSLFKKEKSVMTNLLNISQTDLV